MFRSEKSDKYLLLAAATVCTSTDGVVDHLQPTSGEYAAGAAAAVGCWQ